MLKIRRSRDGLILNLGFPYLGKTVIILRRGPVFYFPYMDADIIHHLTRSIFFEAQNIFLIDRPSGTHHNYDPARAV